MRFEVESQLLFGHILVDIDSKSVVRTFGDQASNISVVDVFELLLWLIFHWDLPHKVRWNVDIKDRRNKQSKCSASIHQFVMCHTFSPVTGSSHVLNGSCVITIHAVFLAKEVHLSKQVAENEVTSCQSFRAS